MTETSPSSRRAVRILGVAFLLYAALVATNEGEFWPFSIYPMFSQAGNPWSRSVVRAVPLDEAPNWRVVGAEDLPGRGYPLLAYGVDPIDLANFVKKTERWTPSRSQALRQMLAPERDVQLRVFRADGRIDSTDSVAVRFLPVAAVTTDTTLLNPTLPR
jgi:hypothetical protein